MLAVVIRKKYQKIPKYFHFADLLELRVDLIKDCGLVWAKSFLKKINKPWILTIRKKSQGGEFNGAEDLRLKLINSYLELKPAFIDLEFDVDLSFVKALRKKHKYLKFIKSFHDFNKTPNNIESFIDSFYHPIFDIHKFAFQANSMQDTLKMMCFLKTNKRSIALVAMGKYGYPLRVVGKILKNAINYASAGKSHQIATQLTIKELVRVYNYKKLNSKTKIYVLIGKKIAHSIGHLFHNFFFLKNNINAVYVKMPLEEGELDSFFSAAKELPIEGVSVTTPFKNLVHSYAIQSKSPINTLKRIDYKWKSKNTDGLGAFKITAHYLKKDAKILLIGAGPTALAIFNVFKKNNFFLDIYNRSFSKACLIYPGNIKIINDFSLVNFSNYDLVINAASYKADFDQRIVRQNLKKRLIFLNVNYQDKNEAHKNPHIRHINGKDLFFSQAVYQQMFWNDQEFSFGIIEKFKKKWMLDLHRL